MPPPSSHQCRRPVPAQRLIASCCGACPWLPGNPGRWCSPFSSGKRALYDFTRLSRAERGEILIPEQQVRLIDDVLHAGGLLIALRRGASAYIPGVTGRCSVADSGPVPLEIRLPGGGSITVNLSRRQFTQILATGALSAALPGSSSAEDASRTARVLDEPARLGGEVLAYFQRALGEYYQADKLLGPRRLIGPVLAQIDVLDDLRRGARPTPTRCCGCWPSTGKMAGWLLQDSGHLDAAASWSRRAGEWAQCAGDVNMNGGVPAGLVVAEGGLPRAGLCLWDCAAGLTVVWGRDFDGEDPLCDSRR